MLTVADVLEALGERCQLATSAPMEMGFLAVTHDSRQASPWSLFVALQGQRDGHDFIADARSRGARGVLAKRLVWSALKGAKNGPFAYFVVDDPLQALQRLASYWRQRFQGEVIAVTGSVGKTTTKEAIAHILSHHFSVHKSPGNLNTEIGVPLALLGLQSHHQKLVLEMGMSGLGEIAFLCSVARPRIGVVTNVGPVHLERLGSIEAIAHAKAELVAALPLDGLAVLNGDDPVVSSFGKQTRANVLLYGTGPACAIRGSHIQSNGLAGLTFTVIHDGQERLFSTPMVGRQNLSAALAAIAVGSSQGIGWTEIGEGLASLPPGFHLRILPGHRGATIIDDTYNANPTSVIAALDLLAEVPGTKIAILGDMLELGAFAEEGHWQVGRRAAQVLDRLIAVGPRARWIAEEARAQGLVNSVHLEHKHDIDLQPAEGDVILIKGSRGMALETVVEALVAEDQPVGWH
ncbi:MAG: UDP-N-acetylmuramoyl-tripeptide--D-alanyl-D-alanine ligase [Chloroflexi bacterium]|nr:UDP-N-acetylmuramoyl-tripeptide--D-alanyl-D-alanine ligase [Chloroflexota bacterium]